MGNETTKISKPSLILEPTSIQSQSKPHYSHNTCVTPSPHTPLTPLTPQPPHTPRTPVTLTNNNNSNHYENIVINSTPLPVIMPLSPSYSNSYGPLSLEHADSLSYSQRLGITSDNTSDFPKTIDDDKIINKNQGRKPKSPRKKTIKKHRKNDDTTTPSPRNNNKYETECKINNGITNKYISEKIAKCASLFWIKNIDVLQRKQQLEIGCLQFFCLLQEHPQLNKFFEKDKIEETALRFFDMFGWLIRSLNLDGVNLWRILAKIGEQHTKMGIKIHYYEFLLDAFHYAMSQTFEQKYTIQVKYCIDQIYIIATCIMTGRQYEQLSTFGERILELNQCQFVESLIICLDYEIGREYLYRYLTQKYCSEIVIFLKLYHEYKEIFSQHHVEKLNQAKQIAKISLSTNSEFQINVSYAAMSEFWSRLRICEMQCESNIDDFEIDPLLFETVVNEIMQLILSNHWVNFTNTIKKMQQEQNSVVNN